MNRNVFAGASSTLPGTSSFSLLVTSVMNRVLNDLPDTFYDSITHWMNEGLNEL